VRRNSLGVGGVGFQAYRGQSMNGSRLRRNCANVKKSFPLRNQRRATTSRCFPGRSGRCLLPKRPMQRSPSMRRFTGSCSAPVSGISQPLGPDDVNRASAFCRLRNPGFSPYSRLTCLPAGISSPRCGPVFCGRRAKSMWVAKAMAHSIYRAVVVDCLTRDVAMRLNTCARQFGVVAANRPRGLRHGA
jgi:hypothetical protein